MSAPSSHGRRSGDSEPWTASSHTYTARDASGGGAGPRLRHAPQGARTEDPKGKRSSSKHGRQEQAPTTRLSPRSSPGSSAVDVAEPRETDNNRIHVARARQSAYEMLPAAIDPNQLVHMALNLSESRRRHINAGQLMASQPRAASGPQREASFSNYGAGGSLRQYLSEQRRASRNISPMGKSSPTRHMSASMQRSGSIPFLSSQTINPSAATLARVDKARAYIELQMEYLRLLQYLPPLKPDANAPGNFVVSSSNVPGSPQAQLTRMPSYAGKQHELGRPYNPLQYIRNRRSRARERLTLHHPPEEFENVEHVHDWVDRVEQYAKHVTYRRDDAVQLPKLHRDHEHSPAPSKPAKPHKGWLFTPQELLADAHWLEQGDNKMLVETRHGRNIFPPREAQQKDLLHPRVSIETSDKRRKSWIDGLPTIALDPTTGDESDKGSDRGRKRRLLPALRTDSPRGGKHSRRGSRLRTHDYSDSSGSDSETRKRKIRVVTDPDHNTGPLALLLEQQAKQYQDKSPAFISPDTPNKWGRDEDISSDNKPSRDSLEVPRPTNGFAYVKDHGNFKIPLKPRPKSSLTIDNIEPRSSLDNQDSTAPSTPHAKQFGHIGSDPSSPASRSGSQTRKSKRSKFNNIFHSHEHSEEHKEHKYEFRPDTAEIDKKGRSRQTSDETSDDKHIGTAILAAPGAVMNLLGHRKNDSVSSLPSPEKLRRRETQEPHSAVTRFLKGVKNEGTKVGDIIFRRDRADDDDSDTMSDHNSVEFDDDVAAKAKYAKRPSINRISTAGTEGSVTSLHKGRNHLDLPSFRPIHSINDEYSDQEHHISRQARERKNSRSPRLDRLLPPRMDLGTISGNSSQGSLSSIHSNGQDQMNQVLARPGVTTREGLPPTGLRNAQAASRQRSDSRPGLNERHWSITDNGDHDGERKNAANMVTQADIARVRALFLCSGVKAKEIVRRAHAQRTPPDFLSRAAATSKAQLYPVPAKEEHVLAARILVKDLESSTRALQSTLESFRDKAIQQLTNQISILQSTVDSDLMPRILEGGDEAVRITSEVSGRGPLQVKQITDEIDRMIRARKRRMRWVRSFGWMLVEWGLVAVMWCVWLIVVLLGSVKRSRWTPREFSWPAPMTASAHYRYVPAWQTSLPNVSSLTYSGIKSSRPSSFAALAAALIPTAAIATLYIVVFIFIRPRFPNIYSPRTYIGTVEEKNRTPCSKSPGYFGWVHTMRAVPDKFMLYHHSLDSYLFLRFLRTLIFICVVGAFITWPILMPTNWTGGGRSRELNRIAIGNVKKKDHLYAHALVAWVFFSFVMFTVARERLWLIGLRQAWKLSKANAKRLSSRTVLYLSAPTAALDESNMQRFFGNDAVRIWPVTKGDKLVSLVSERNSRVEKLESAEMALILKVHKEVGKSHNRNIKYEQLPKQMKKALRPTHKSKTPVVGKEVDSINYYRDQIKEKENEIEKARESNETAESPNGAAAVFVEYRTQPAAQRAYQQVASSDVLALAPRFLGHTPRDIVWENLNLPPARRISQSGVAISLVVATIVFWSIPVSIVGAFSNVQYLAENFKWLSFLNKLPPTLMNLLSGLLPPLLLSALASYVPNIFRYIFTTFGDPTKTVIELKVLKWYYIFQVLQVFLVTTLSSGAAAVASQIAQDPSSVPQLLAERLPRASNTYLAYFIVQALTNAPSNILNYTDVLFYVFYDKFWDKTPRQKYNTYTSMRGMSWGKLFPKYGNFAIIAIAYACIAPLVLGFAAIGIAIFYFSYRYQLLYTVQPKIDTKGHAYTLALQQLLTGVYIAELCLIGLFSLRNATGPLFMLIVLFFATAVSNYTMNRYLAPLEEFMPADLAPQSEDDEQAPLLSSAEEGDSDVLRRAEQRIDRVSERTHVPARVISPLARFLQPHVFASHAAMKQWLRDGDFDFDDEPQYKEEDMKKAYLNPAFTSKTPVIWLARDSIGVSKNEIGENEKVELKATDQGAWVTGDGKLKWSVDNFEEVPVFTQEAKW
ncbi:hyp1 [Pyrenophora seminiperda CCB06]|uniref:Hyp1 n=1 Tax=Pyrenophora seminiperda CCB06 TaxID=1302712 RepID=A0A3M7MCC1_9PLEO|nr:hyp1 [Pyrenophora seminiperda CCB06]